MDEIRALSVAARIGSWKYYHCKWDIEQGHEQIEIQKQENKGSNGITGRAM
jgi:hypothetical protein